MEECQSAYGGQKQYGGGPDCQSVPKEVCSQVAVPNCRQIADEQVSLYREMIIFSLMAQYFLSVVSGGSDERVRESAKGEVPADPSLQLQTGTFNTYFGILYF